MHNVSEDFREVVVCSGREWHYRAQITLKDGTAYDLNDQDFIQGGLHLSSTSSATTEFTFGGVLADELRIVLNNYDGRYSTACFDGAEVAIYAGLVIEQNWEKGNLIEWVRLGTFTAEKSTLSGLTIAIQAFDHTFAFEKVYADTSSLKYPATLKEILQDLCDCCGVVLATQEFTNMDYVVDERPAEQSYSCRQMLEDISRLAGCFAMFDEYGKLVLRWYDDKQRPCMNVEYPDTMWSYDVTITGIKVKNALTDETVVFGEDGYVVEMIDNRLIQNNMEQAIQNLADKTFGFTFRPFTSDINANPALEIGDAIMLYDRHGNSCRSYIMKVDYYMGKPMNIGAYSKTPSCNNGYVPRLSVQAVETSQKKTDQKINLYDTYAKQFAAMASASVGYYTTEEVQDDGSVILYSHDKPKLEDSVNIWKKTGLVVAVSNDGGKTWRGLDKDGNAILNDIAAKTIIADKIKTGRLEGYSGESYWDFDTGEMLVSGTFQQYDTKGYKSVDIKNNRLNVYDWESNGDLVGSVGTVRNVSTGRRDIALYADIGAYLALGVKSSDGDGINSYIKIHDDQTNPIQLYGHVYGNGATIRNVQIRDCPQLIPFNNVTSFQLMNGSNGVYLEIGNGSKTWGVDVWASDKRLKKSIKKSKISALEQIEKIPHHSFTMKDSGEEVKCGYVAQELEEINPEFVLKVTQPDGNESYQVRAQAVIPVLTKAIQELSERIAKLERKHSAEN